MKVSIRKITPIEKVKPCLFCKESHSIMIMTDGLQWWAECDIFKGGCGARGSITGKSSKKNEVDAVDAWNKVSAVSNER